MTPVDPDIAAASTRNGLTPFAAIALVLAGVYAGWCALGARDPGDPFGAWSDAAQTAPGPAALPEPEGAKVPPPPAEEDDDESR